MLLRLEVCEYSHPTFISRLHSEINNQRTFPTEVAMTPSIDYFETCLDRVWQSVIPDLMLRLSNNYLFTIMTYILYTYFSTFSCQPACDQDLVRAPFPHISIYTHLYITSCFLFLAHIRQQTNQKMNIHILVKLHIFLWFDLGRSDWITLKFKR